MKLDAKDREAIGRSRANRDIPQNIKYLLYVSLILCVAGIYVALNVAMYGFVIVIVGMAVLWYYSSVVEKRRKIMVKRVNQEWREEQDNERAK